MWPDNTSTTTSSWTIPVYGGGFQATAGTQLTYGATVPYAHNNGLYYSINTASTANTRPRPSNADPVARLAEERRYAQARQEEAHALERALTLLQECLSAEQCKRLDDDGYVPVVGASGSRYHVLYGQVRNVVEVDELGHTLARWCCRPGGNRGAGLPDPDAMLAQVLLLETDDARFKRLANYVGAA